MSRYRLAAAALFVVSLVLLSGCGGGVSRREVLADLTDHVITQRFASTQRGLSALEYLLFQDDDRLLRELGEPSSRFGECLRSLTAVIAEETAGVRDAWSGADGDQFAGRGDRVIAESLAIADLVRVTIFLTETVGDMQLGGALGALNGEPEIEAIPGGAAAYALDDLYYFISLAGLLICILPTHCAWSLDARRLRSDGVVPRWTVWALRSQVAVLYAFAGLAKLNPDWLLNAAPLSIWLPQHAGLPLIGPLLDELWVAYALSWAGAAFDLSVVAWLLWGRSRPIAFVVLIVFHLLTGQLFMIGVFPWMMIAAALIFFAPDWPRRLQRLRPAKLRERPKPPEPRALAERGQPTRRVRALVLIGLVAFAVQVVVPRRHQLYPGSVRWNEEGYRFSWRVLLTEKVGSVEYRVTDSSDGRTWLVDPATYLSALQAERMTTQPDLILATAQIIRDDYAAQGRDVEVRADAFVAVNGRPYARLIDPEVDLARERQGVGAKRWILPEP